MVKQKFRIFGTGHPIPGGPLWSDRSHTSIAIEQPDGGYIRYIDTFFQPPFVWHLFAVVEKVIGLDNWNSDVEP